MSQYTCAKCGKAVELVNGEIKRYCDCNEAVIAHMSARMRGESSMASKR
jgi:DNA-directed RNA polymerase subunit RPC12/RpoP